MPKTEKIIVEISLDTDHFNEQLKELKKNVNEFSEFCDEHGLNMNSRKSWLYYKFKNLVIKIQSKSIFKT